MFAKTVYLFQDKTGVEFDPFKIRIVQHFPKSQVLNRIFESHPIFDNVFWLEWILLTCNVCDTDIINPILQHCTDTGIFNDYLFLLCHMFATKYVVFFQIPVQRYNKKVTYASTHVTFLNISNAHHDWLEGKSKANTMRYNTITT